ncbi:nitrite reductase (NAD(P)H) small subunit [Phaeacidiphilus oryzae]|uniref:nitrite reductase (NAD(P)H) small subunit n=1 Tax=Phaeacidiphilus oryzae TaxID=348818 RepID=UPI000A04CF76|nr:nitrite reductase (NAD(P)H) small subunit [Phaeacidiphilus oryzae]
MSQTLGSTIERARDRDREEGPCAQQVVELLWEDGWLEVCPVDRLTPGRGVAVLLPDGRQAALFLLRSGELYAVGNRDPFSGAWVMSRGITGSRGTGPDAVPTVASPMYKQAFDLRSGACLDEPLTPEGEPAGLGSYRVRAVLARQEVSA